MKADELEEDDHGVHGEHGLPEVSHLRLMCPQAIKPAAQVLHEATARLVLDPALGAARTVPRSMPHVGEHLLPSPPAPSNAGMSAYT